jgi:hypothetical protein
MRCHPWIAAAAALVIAACGGGSPSTGVDAGAQPASSDVPQSYVCSSRSGYFPCGQNLCSRAVQACYDGGCEWYGAFAPACGSCPSCACIQSQTTLNLASCDDDGAGGITFAVRPPGGDGDPCKVDGDCQYGLCQNGACECQPAGASAQFRDGQSDCCSGWYLGGTCGAQPGSPCITRVTDCFGGTCLSGTCACVGPGGGCSADTDCCAGATRCVQLQCQ